MLRGITMLRDIPARLAFRTACMLLCDLDADVPLLPAVARSFRPCAIHLAYEVTICPPLQAGEYT